MIRSWLVPSFGGLFGDGWYLDLACADRLHYLDQRMGDQQVVDEFASAPEDTGEALLLGNKRCQVPQSLPVAGVRAVEPTGANLRTRRAVQELSSSCLRPVVQVAATIRARC
jgi:hypothetical protein